MFGKKGKEKELTEAEKLEQEMVAKYGKNEVEFQKRTGMYNLDDASQHAVRDVLNKNRFSKVMAGLLSLTSKPEETTKIDLLIGLTEQNFVQIRQNSELIKLQKENNELLKQLMNKSEM